MESQESQGGQDFTTGKAEGGPAVPMSVNGPSVHQPSVVCVGAPPQNGSAAAHLQEGIRVQWIGRHLGEADFTHPGRYSWPSIAAPQTWPATDSESVRIDTACDTGESANRTV
jgi:hypothetical protein